MHISKSTHLKRLLQTQDMLMATLTFVVVADGLWLFDRLNLTATMSLLRLIPLVLFLGVIASTVSEPKLHDQLFRAQVRYAAQFTVVVLFGLLGIAYVTKLTIDSQVFSAVLGVSLFSVLIGNRLFLKWWYLESRKEHPSNYLKVLIIGSGKRAQEIISSYKSTSDWGVEIVGILDPDQKQTGKCIGGHHVLGGLSEIRSILDNQVVDEVVVCLPRSLIDNLDEIVSACEEQAVCLKFMADIYDMAADVIKLGKIGTRPVLSFEPVSHDEGARIVKRIAELLLALAVMPVMLPLFALVAIAIKLDSPGPVFFLQERVGLNKRPFKMIKFRSMYQDAEARLKEVEHLNEADGPIFKIRNDPRVTRVGRVLRTTSIDELPQLLNVLRGHMSLVGPRPMSVRDVGLFTEGVQRKRFSVRPGLACLREVSGRSQLSFSEWLELDLKYIDEWSLWLDVCILVRLVPVVLRGEGAS